MGQFEKGVKINGRRKGSKNKATVLLEYKGFTEADKLRVFNAAMKLVDEGNVTIIGKMIDKMLPPAIPKDDEGNPIMPEIRFNVIAD